MSGGRSPRARGSRPVAQGVLPAAGSIPAGAGEPSGYRARPCSAGVDPRGRGGAAEWHEDKDDALGRSPRARGSPESGVTDQYITGSIPAGAGEPPTALDRLLSDRVDPRGRGGAHLDPAGLGVVGGRSPRARGSLDGARVTPRLFGSIPAGAGEPRRPPKPRAGRGVDPRGRGGAMPVARNVSRMPGRSPRARGSLDCNGLSIFIIGSIPAGAGEPTRSGIDQLTNRVDPRGRGGAMLCCDASARISGRSPRARGSLRPLLRDHVHVGSIPAGAGEPARSISPPPCHRVDPRGRGGAHRGKPNYSVYKGRSPRARGSLRLDAGVGLPAGSIPAGAGEPAGPSRRAGGARVDPRGRGGAAIHRSGGNPTMGRSPRARGSHLFGSPIAFSQGSIPAGAGEPARRRGRPWRWWVDPRGRGGAAKRPRKDVIARGRSPRARGSRAHPRGSPARDGSIPAGAGEPL